MNLKNCLQKIIKKPKSNVILCFLVLIILFFLFIGNYNLIEGNTNDDTHGINKIIENLQDTKSKITEQMTPSKTCVSDCGSSSESTNKSHSRSSGIKSEINGVLANSQGSCPNNC